MHGSRSFRYKVVLLQVVSLQHESIRYTHKVGSLHILGHFASNSISPKVDSLHFRNLILNSRNFCEYCSVASFSNVKLLRFDR